MSQTPTPTLPPHLQAVHDEWSRLENAGLLTPPTASGPESAPHYSLLIELIRKDDVEGARTVLQSGADPNAVPPPLSHISFSMRYAPNGAPLQADTRPELTERIPVLFFAANEGSAAMVEVLLSHGADARKAKQNGTTVLHFLACNSPSRFDGQVRGPEWAQDVERKVALLVGAGADVNAVNGQETPLHEALTGQREPALALSLLRHGADPTRVVFGDNALQAATVYVQVEAMEAMIKGGMDPTEVGVTGRTLLHRLAGAHFQEKFLDGLPASNPFIAPDFRKAVDLLARHGVDLEARTPEGNTALHLAADQGHAGATMALVEAGANIQARNDAQETPIVLADRKPGDVGAVLRAALARQTLVTLHAGLSSGLQP